MSGRDLARRMLGPSTSKRGTPRCMVTRRGVILNVHAYPGMREINIRSFVRTIWTIQ